MVSVATCGSAQWWLKPLESFGVNIEIFLPSNQLKCRFIAGWPRLAVKRWQRLLNQANGHSLFSVFGKCPCQLDMFRSIHNWPCFGVKHDFFMSIPGVMILFNRLLGRMDIIDSQRRNLTKGGWPTSISFAAECCGCAWIGRPACSSEPVRQKSLLQQDEVGRIYALDPTSSPKRCGRPQTIT